MYKFAAAKNQKSRAKTDVKWKNKPLEGSNQLDLERLRRALGTGARRDRSEPGAARYSRADRADRGASQGQERQLPYAAGGVIQRKQSSAPAVGEKGTGVVQCTLWRYSEGRWNGISKFEEERKYEFPADPVENMYFDDNTGEIFLHGQDEYVDCLQSLAARRADRASIYQGRISTFAQNPHRMNVCSPADPKGDTSQIYKLWGQYLVSAKGLGKRSGGRTGPPAYADFYDDVEYPPGTFTRLADDFLQPDGRPITPLPTALSERARTRAATAYSIQYAEEVRQPTGGMFPTMFFRAADKVGMKKAVAEYPFAQKGGTEQTRKLVRGEARFTQGQADTFLPFAPPSPQPQHNDDD